MLGGADFVPVCRRAISPNLENPPSTPMPSVSDSMAYRSHSNLSIRCVLLVVVLGALPRSAFGIDYTWDVTIMAGLYDDATNWVPNSATPSVGDTATFRKSAQVRFTQIEQIEAVTIAENAEVLLFAGSPGIEWAVNGKFDVQEATSQGPGKAILDNLTLNFTPATGVIGLEGLMELRNGAALMSGVIDGGGQLILGDDTLLEGVVFGDSTIQDNFNIQTNSNSAVIRDATIHDVVGIDAAPSTTDARIDLEGTTALSAGAKLGLLEVDVRLGGDVLVDAPNSAATIVMGQQAELLADVDFVANSGAQLNVDLSNNAALHIGSGLIATLAGNLGAVRLNSSTGTEVTIEDTGLLALEGNVVRESRPVSGPGSAGIGQ